MSMKVALASTVVGVSRAAWPTPREEATYKTEEAASSTPARVLLSKSNLAEGYLGSSGACDPTLPALTRDKCYINADVGIFRPNSNIMCDPEFCLPRYECNSEGSCQPIEPEINPFQDFCAFNKNLCAYQSVICDRHAGVYFDRGGNQDRIVDDCNEPPQSCSISNCCDDATCAPDIPPAPASDISLSDANCDYHSKMCDKACIDEGIMCDEDIMCTGIHVAGSSRFASCHLSERCCNEETQEGRDLCYKIHECIHNADYYYCAGELTCYENFQILGYDTNVGCTLARFELSSCPFRECCQDAGWDMDKVRECVYGEEPAPEDIDEPEDEDTACLAEEDCAAAASRMGMEFSSGLFPTSGCFSKKNKAYFSPGTKDDMTKADLPGVQERIHCNDDPPPREDNTPCLDESECDGARKEEGIDEFLGGDFPTHGCFKKNGKAYWGIGGSSDEVSKEDLPGIQERIYCPRVGVRSSVVLSNISLAESEMGVSGANVASLGLSIFLVVAVFSTLR